jgi:antitoxin (DNA-binding transcriptional repressor) of toxin-antitoxin stability system
MTAVTVTQFTTHPGAALASAEKGESVAVRKGRSAVAYLIPATLMEAVAGAEDVREAVTRLREIQTGKVKAVSLEVAAHRHGRAQQACAPTTQLAPQL